MLEKEMAKLIATSLNSNSLAAHEKEVKELQDRIASLKNEAETAVKREKALLEQVKEIQGELALFLIRALSHCTR